MNERYKAVRLFPKAGGYQIMDNEEMHTFGSFHDDDGFIIELVVEQFNKQDKEIKELKSSLDAERERHEETAKENEQLLSERNYFERKKTEYLVSLNGCRLMNTQLKSEIKDLNDVLARYEEKHGDVE